MGDFVTSVRDDMFAMRWNFYAVVFAACWCRGRAGQVTGVTLQLRRNLDLVAGHLAALCVYCSLSSTDPGRCSDCLVTAVGELLPLFWKVAGTQVACRSLAKVSLGSLLCLYGGGGRGRWQLHLSS